MMNAKTLPSRPRRRNRSISEATHWDFAERGEQMTIMLSDSSMDFSTMLAMLDAAAISSSSRKKRPSRSPAGTRALVPAGRR